MALRGFFKHRLVVNGVLLLGTLGLVASVWWRSGRTEANSGLGYDGVLYAQLMVDGPDPKAPNQRMRPLIPDLNRYLYDWQFRAKDGPAWPHQKDGVEPTFQIANFAYAALLAIFLLALLDLYGASTGTKAVFMGNVFGTVAVTKMFGFYPVLVDLGVYAFITIAIYAVLRWPRVWIVVATTLAVLSREFGLVVLAFGVHRDLRLRASWWRSLLTYAPALIVWLSLREYVSRTSTKDPVSALTALRHLGIFVSDVQVPLFSVYFFLTVFGGVSCFVGVLALCGRLRPIREHEWLTYTALVGILTIGGGADVWRYWAYVLPAVPVLFVANWRGGTLQTAVLTGLTLVTQRPWIPIDNQGYFEEWFPLWRTVLPSDGNLSAQFWPQWEIRFVAVVIGVFFIWKLTSQTQSAPATT